MARNPSGSIDWYGVKYPSIDDLEDMAWSLGAVVVYGRTAFPFYVPASASLAFGTIGIPQGLSPLRRFWGLAHEVGHCVLHAGRLGPFQRGRQEAQADRWAACALIPEERIVAHGNASLDSFVAAISAHYEHLPFEDCDSRRLAALIAEIRMNCMEVCA